MPYEFSVFPADVLGRVYEQFLERVITHKDNRTKPLIEEKPEVRKARGVYYTPEYIVKYIVEHTVGALVNGKKIRDVEQIKVIDPACGSGSFLIVAYQFLLDAYLELYINDGIDKHSKGTKPILFITSDGTYQLTLEERKRILLNNIYGVDIDRQAVEVTKLSLLLKVLEYEGEEIKQQSLFNERVLPDLSNNIKCGNSLISTSVFAGTLAFDHNELSRINPFDWDVEFKEITQNGGFDCVIGNPPYVDSEEMVKTNPLLRDYATQDKYIVAKGNWDMYCIFTELGTKVLKNNGFLGFIIPNKFLSMTYGDAMREYLSKYHVKEIIDYSSVKVFFDFSKKKYISVYPIVILVNKNDVEKKCIYKKIVQEDHLHKILYEKTTLIEDKLWASKFDVLSSIIEEIENNCKLLSEYCFLESTATVNEAYTISEIVEERKYSRKYFKLINSGTIDRYGSLWGTSKTQYIKKSYYAPLIEKTKLEDILPKRRKQSSSEKVIFANMTKCVEAVLDKDGEYYAGKSTTILLPKNLVDLRLMLALVNSNIFNMIFKARNKYTAMQGGAMNINKNNLSMMPVPNISNIDRKFKDSVINYVETMNDLVKEYNTVTAKEEKQILMKQIKIIDSKINQSIYQLYGLTDEEIKIIEDKTTS